MNYTYKTIGTCSSLINIETDDDNKIIKKVEYIGGCNGNLNGISRIVEGMKVDDVISKFKGVHCGMKPTSCPDQLARALEQMKKVKESA